MSLLLPPVPLVVVPVTSTYRLVMVSLRVLLLGVPATAAKVLGAALIASGVMPPA